MTRRGLGIGLRRSALSGLFGAAEVWFDARDLSTLWQDAAGTIPVTASGQPVGLWRDKSGMGRDASQPVAAKRPTYQVVDGKPFVVGDGVDDNLVTPVFDLSSTADITVGAIMRPSLSRFDAVAVEFGTSYVAPGEFYISSNSSYDAVNIGGPSYRQKKYKLNGGTNILIIGMSRPDLQSPKVRCNGVEAGVFAYSGTTTGPFGVYPLSVFSRFPNGSAAPCAFGELVLISRLLSIDETVQMEAALASRSGVSL